MATVSVTRSTIVDADADDFAELIERGELGRDLFATPGRWGEVPATWLNPPKAVQ